MTKTSRGFTLLEVLMELTVLGLIFVLLGRAMRAGSRAGDFVHRLLAPESEREPVERAVRHMFERMDPGTYPDPPVVRGQANTLVFTSDLPSISGGGVLPADARLEISGGNLSVWWSPRTGGRPYDPRSVSRTVLTNHILSGELSYAAKTGPAIWLKTWDRPELPSAIRLRLTSDLETGPWPPLIVSPKREQAEE